MKGTLRKWLWKFLLWQKDFWFGKGIRDPELWGRDKHGVKEEDNSVV